MYKSKFSLHHEGGVEVLWQVKIEWSCTLHSVLTLALDGNEWLTSYPGFFAPRNEPQYLLNSRLGGCCCWSGHFGEERILLPLLGFKLLALMRYCVYLISIVDVTLKLGYFSASHMDVAYLQMMCKEYEIIYQLDAIEYLFVFFQLDMFRAYTPIFRSNGCYSFFTYAAYGVLGVVRCRS